MWELNHCEVENGAPFPVPMQNASHKAAGVVYEHNVSEVLLAPPPSWPDALILQLYVETGEGDAEWRAWRAAGAAVNARPSTRFTLFARSSRSGGGGERVGRALLTYQNMEVNTVGPTLEMLEVKRSWRCRGLGTVLLNAVERHCIDAAAASERTYVELSFCNVTGSRGFFEACGVLWRESFFEGHKEFYIVPPAGGLSARRLIRAMHHYGLVPVEMAALTPAQLETYAVLASRDGFEDDELESEEIEEAEVE